MLSVNFSKLSVRKRTVDISEPLALLSDSLTKLESISSLRDCRNARSSCATDLKMEDFL